MMTEKLLSCFKSGKVSVKVEIDGRHAFDARAEGREIMVDVKDTLLAAEMAMKAAGKGMGKLALVKKAGFRVKVNVSGSEFEL